MWIKRLFASTDRTAAAMDRTAAAANEIANMMEQARDLFRERFAIADTAAPVVLVPPAIAAAPVAPELPEAAELEAEPLKRGRKARENLRQGLRVSRPDDGGN